MGVGEKRPTESALKLLNILAEKKVGTFGIRGNTKIFLLTLDVVISYLVENALKIN